MYVQGKTYDACVHNVLDTIIEIDTLGLATHQEKSVFIPPPPTTGNSGFHSQLS